MKNNIDKIKRLKEELKEVINEYNSIDSDFDLSSNIELLNEEAKELNQILSFLDVENSDLLKKIEFLKEDVNRRIQKLASENPFQTILKKFQKVYGKDCFDILDLNDFYDNQDKKNSISNKDFDLKKVKDSNEYLNTLFEEEIKKVKDISSNKQDFILNNFDTNSFSSLSKEEKLFYIFSKIDELKEKFQINLDFEISKNNDEIDYQSNNLLVNNIIDVVTKGYDDLKNEFTKKISWDEFVEKESDFNKGKTIFDKKTGNFKNLISNANLLENKYQKRLTDLFNSPVKNKFIELVNEQELDFHSYQTELKNIFDSLYSTNQSLLKVKFDLSLNSYLKFLESIEIQIKNIENQNNETLLKNQENFLLEGKEKDFSVEKTYYNQLCEISDKFIKKLQNQKVIIDDYSKALMFSFDSITFNNDYDSIISKINSDTKQYLQITKNTFDSLKKELKAELNTLKKSLYIDKESQIYLISQQIIDLLNKGIDSSAKNLVNDLEEYLEQVQDFFRDFFSKKIDLVEDKLSATENFEINNNKLPEKFVDSASLKNDNKTDSNVVLISLINKKIENLEDKFANFANILENINNKLNKNDTDDTNKSYIEEISKNINNKFEELLQNLKSEMNSVSENNHNFVSGLIESNNKEREYITNLLEKIDYEYQSTLDELELKRIAEGNKKLQDLENLIILQNQELQELLDDKNEVINEIERVINQKTKNEQTSKNLEKVIEQISKNFESKIDNLESKFNEKLEEINVNSMIISSTDNDLYREITRNISELESQLSNNYESVKNSFKENFSEIISKINTYGESSSHSELLNRKIEELNVLLDSLKNDNKESLKNIAQDLQESSKKGVSQILESFDDKIGSIGKKIENKVDWYESNRQEEFNTLSEKLSNKLENLVADINRETEQNQRLVFDLIENNNKEKEYIINYLQKIDDEHQNTLSELESKVVSESSRKLQTLEDLIILQNNELEELLDDRNNAINEIEKIINSKVIEKESDAAQLEKTISEISKNFESRIDSLESRFNDKLQEIHIDSLTLASTDNDLYREITRNISGLENQLVSNYESVKTSFKESFDNLINKIGNENQDDYNSVLNKRMDELNVLLDSLKSDNKESLKNIAQDLQESSKKGVSQILESFNDKIGSIGQEIGSKVDWYENSRDERFNDLSEKINSQLKSLIEDINDSTDANQRLVTDLIENNNKEKEYIINYLQKIDNEHQNTLNELESKVISESSRKLQTLEDLIILQNNELEELLDDRNNAINEIEKIINSKVIEKESDAAQLEKTISEISKNFESRIDSLESRFNDKLQEIHVDSLTLASTDNDLYREITRNISGLENQLVSNYESVKTSFKESFDNLINKIGYENQNDYNSILNKRMDELNVLIDSLREKNELSFQTLEENLKESSKKDVSQILENFNDRIGSIGQEIGSKVDWYESSRDERFNDLSEKINNQLKSLIEDINESTDTNQRLVADLIENNNKEKKYIVDFLQKIDSIHQSTLNELEVKVITESSRKLQALEDLIILQNNELEELLDDRNNVINEIEKVINGKIKSQDTNPIHLEKTVSEISKNFESRIDSLESRFNDKLQEIHVDSLTLASTDNDLYRELSRNISGLENQLISNYESVKNSFKESFTDLINKIGYGNQSDYNEILNRKIDELNILVDSLKEKNDVSFKTLEDNLKALSQKDVSQIIESFDDKIGSISEKLENKVDWYESNRQEEFNTLSERLSNKLENLVADINRETEQNQLLVTKLIENNNKEKDYIINFLHKIDSFHQSTLNELEAKVITESSRKLQTLEDLIILQNNELEELLDDRNSVINEIEKVINNRVKNNEETNPAHLEETILEISKNFESRIDSLESRFNDKLQEIHVDSLTLASTDNDLYREISRNINGLENQLVHNYESVKNSFKESFDNLINKINYDSQSEYNNALSRKMDELNILVENLRERNEASLQALEENLRESSKKDVSQILESLDTKIGSIGQELGSKVDWYENSRDERFNDLSNNINSQLKSLIEDINDSTDANQRLVTDLIENNNKEKNYILDFLQRADFEHKSTLNELESRVIAESSRKLQTLEDLIILQNNELEELLDDRNNVINEIEKVITNRVKNNETDPIHLEKTILEISKNFESRIDNLESRFNDKLQEIHVDSLSLASTDNDLYREITRNINGLENQLINNYESVKNSFKESFAEIINKIGYGNQNDYNEILSRKIDELNALVDSLKEKNEESFLVLEKNLKASSKKDISEMFESFNDKLGSISQEIGSKVDWYENNRQEELNTLSEKISNQLKYLINDIHNERLVDNQRFVDQIIMNNENEKQYIISLLSKMNEERLNSIDENNLSRIMENNRRMQVLEDLIMLQNNELQELLEDKNSAIDEIENVILKNKEKLIKNGNSEELKEGISGIIEKFDSKIADLQNKLEEKFTKIGDFAEGLDGVVSREIANSMSELENKLIENYESIKNSFKESFQDIENWVLSIASDKNDFADNPKLNEILEAITDLKKDAASFNSNELYENISATLLNELNKFSLNQYSLFENLEKNILSAIDKNVFDSIMDDFDYRLKELIEQVSSRNAENLKEIDDKLILASDQFNTLYKMDKEEIGKKLNESLNNYQSLLERSLEIINNNYLNLKDLVQKVLDRDREEFTASELKKIVSLENKFNNLEKLVLLQDEQTRELLNEKQNLLEKLVSLLNDDNKDFDDVLRIISIIDEKVRKFSNVLSNNLEITKNISEGNVFNETSQISDRVDALSQYLKTVSNNLDLLNLDYENIWMLDEIKNFGNLEFIHSKLNSLIDEVQSIGDYAYNDVQVIKKLDQIKLDLLSIENDLKLIRISINSNNDSDIKEFNLRKSDFIANLIKENKVLISNLLEEKENLVKNVTDKAIFDNSISELQKNDLEILLEGKAGIIFEVIFKEIQKIQEENFANFNVKLNELKNRFANDFGWEVNNQVPYPFAVNKKLLEKIESLEKNIHKIFNEIDDKKNSFLNKLDSKVNNDELVEKIVNKFDKEKESLSETHKRKRKELRDLIINFKSKELDTYRKKLESLNLEIKNLKNSASLNDDNLLDFENSVDQGSQKLSLLEDLIENLTLEIDSFDEEKRAMLSEIEGKIDYLDDLNNPLKEGIIELESDNWNSDKFKKVVSKEAQEIINDKFLELKKDYDYNIEKIEVTIDDLKNINNQLSEIDKKLSDTTSLDKRINDLEDLVFEPVKKSEEQNNKKISNNHLKLINDNVKFYVDELEKKKIEIANFYRKVRNLAESRRRK